MLHDAGLQASQVSVRRLRAKWTLIAKKGSLEGGQYPQSLDGRSFVHWTRRNGPSESPTPCPPPHDDVPRVKKAEGNYGRTWDARRGQPVSDSSHQQPEFDESVMLRPTEPSVGL